MIEVLLQFDGDRLVPHSLADRVELTNLKRNQIVKAKISGVGKIRSYQQLKLFWACCNTVAENTDDFSWNTAEKVAEQCKIAIQFIDYFFSTPNGLVIKTKSISFANLKHMEACNFFDQAFLIMAKKLNVTVNELVQNAE